MNKVVLRYGLIIHTEIINCFRYPKSFNIYKSNLYFYRKFF